jgi:hypothetical protein
MYTTVHVAHGANQIGRKLRDMQKTHDFPWLVPTPDENGELPLQKLVELLSLAR